MEKAEQFDYFAKFDVTDFFYSGEHHDIVSDIMEVYEGLNAQAQHLLRAVPRTEGPPHAATGENGRVHPEPLY